MGNKEILLIRILRKYPDFDFLFEDPKDNKWTADVTEKINEVIHKGIRKYKSYFLQRGLDSLEYKDLTKKTLYRFFENYKPGKPINTKGVACQFLVYYVIFKKFEEATIRNDIGAFKRYARDMESDLLSSNPDISWVSLWKMTGNWYLYISMHGKYFRLPVRFNYNGFDKPLDLELKHIDGTFHDGVAKSGYSSGNKFSKKELWCEAFGKDDTSAFQMRIYLDGTTLSGKLLTSGVATFNYLHNDTSKEVIFSSPILLEPADFKSFEDEESCRIDLDEKQNHVSKLFKTEEDRHERTFFLERRRDFSTPNFAPSDISGLANINTHYDIRYRKFYLSQKPSEYKSLKARLSGEWYSLARISTKEDQISLHKLELTFEDSKRNIKVERFNHLKDSHMEGFIDRTGWNLYLLLRGKTGNRNGFITFALQEADDTTPSIFHAIGVSRHKKTTPLAWRELLIQFPQGVKKPEAFKKLLGKSNNITYQEFLKIDESVISRKDKLYLANRDQGTLTYPTEGDSITKQYLRQQNAAHYCSKDYFVYLPFSYNDKDELFRLTLTIDNLAKAILKVKYPDINDSLKYTGLTYSILNTLQISLFSEQNQHVQILCNTSPIPSSNIILDGIILCTDRNGKSIASRCLLIQSSLITDGENSVKDINIADVIDIRTNGQHEYSKIFDILRSDPTFKIQKIDELDDYFATKHVIRSSI